MAGPPRPPVGRRRIGGAIVLVVLLVAVLAGAWWGINAIVGGPSAAPGTPVEVVVPPGASATQIAEILADADVVPSASGFVDQIEADGLGVGFRPGTYTFRTDEEYRRIVDQLNAGPADTAAADRLVVPEGWAIWDIEAEVPSVGITKAQYRAALDAHGPPEGFLRPGEQAATLEGFLFPATYDVGQPADADALVQDQIGAFSANVAGVDMSYAASRNLTPYDVLKIASLVERESRDPEDRRKVAGLIYNRLKADMTLGIDSANQYSTGDWGVLTAADLELDSPYNLRLVKGLPPTPICNPGLDAIRAAAKPAKVDYLYMYAIKDDPKGRHYFTDSYEDFLRYQKENPYS